MESLFHFYSGDALLSSLNETFTSKFLQAANEVESDNAIESCVNDYHKYSLSLIAYAIQGTKELESMMSFFVTSNFKESEYPVAARKFVNALWLCGIQIESSSPTWKMLCILLNSIAGRGFISIDTLQTSLEFNLLTGAGLLGGNAAEDEKRIEKKLVKLNTNVMYRQQKYSMLEEEKEGFSILIVLSASLPSYPADVSPQIKQILSIIGQLDLDPNRVLDVVLDAFEKSTWNYSYILLLNRLNYRTRYISEIIGFKLKYYHTPEVVAPDCIESMDMNMDTMTVSTTTIVTTTAATTTTTTTNVADSTATDVFKFDDVLKPPVRSPAQLYGLVANLITCNVLQIEDVLPYLQPNREKTVEEYKTYLVERKEAVRDIAPVSLSALRASTTSSSGETDYKQSDKQQTQLMPDWVLKETKVKEFAYAEGNQIYGLLSALITNRCWNAATVIFEMLELESINAVSVLSVRDALSSTIDWVISDLYESVNPFAGVELSTGSTNGKSTVVRVDGVERPYEMTPSMGNQLQKIVDSKENLCHFPHLIDAYIFRLGHHLSNYPTLFQKLCRLVESHVNLLKSHEAGNELKKDGVSNAIDQYEPAFNMIRKVFLPALSCGDLSGPNYLLSRQIWKILSIFPYHIRFGFYDSWYGMGVGTMGLNDPSKPIDCCHAEMVTTQNVRALLKRITSENAKVMGKKMARFFPTCPLVVFDFLIKNVCAYENMLPVFIDMLKYASELSFDCLAYALVRKLRLVACGKGHSEQKLKEGEASVAQWFGSFSKFTAAFYTRYPTTEIGCLFDYLLHQTGTGVAEDLILLKDLLTIMGGCRSIGEVSQDQLSGLSGGRVLSNETLRGCNTDAIQAKASRVLHASLIKYDCALPLLMNVAQLRQTILYAKSVKSLKMTSYLHNISQDILMQFTDFIVGSELAQLQNLAEKLPSMDIFLNEFNLNISVVFQLIRPLVRAALVYGVDPNSSPLWLRNWHPFGAKMRSAVESTASFISCKIVMSYELYIFFWSLSLYDLNVPSACYVSEIEKFTKSKTDNEKKHQKASGRSSYEAKVEARAARDEIKKCDKLISALQLEKATQEEHVKIIRSMMVDMAVHFFPTSTNETMLRSTRILVQECVYHRATLSPMDALFSVHFFNVLSTNLGVSGFSFMLFSDSIFCSFPALLFESTEGEARYIGDTLNSLLAITNSLFSSEEKYLASIKGISGYLVNGNGKEVEGEAGTEKNESVGDEPKYYSYSFFKSCFHDWHDQLLNTLTTCINSKEYMHIRSGLLCLDKIHQQFPVWIAGGNELLQCLEDIINSDTDHNDLHLMSTSLKTGLKKQSSKWLNELGKTIQIVSKTPASTVVVEPVKTVSKKVIGERVLKNSSQGNDLKRQREGGEVEVDEQEFQRRKERNARERLQACMKPKAGTAVQQEQSSLNKSDEKIDEGFINQNRRGPGAGNDGTGSGTSAGSGNGSNIGSVDYQRRFDDPSRYNKSENGGESRMQSANRDRGPPAHRDDFRDQRRNDSSFRGPNRNHTDNGARQEVHGRVSGSDIRQQQQQQQQLLLLLQQQQQQQQQQLQLQHQRNSQQDFRRSDDCGGDSRKFRDLSGGRPDDRRQDERNHRPPPPQTGGNQRNFDSRERSNNNYQHQKR